MIADDFYTRFGDLFELMTKISKCFNGASSIIKEQQLRICICLVLKNSDFDQ